MTHTERKSMASLRTYISKTIISKQLRPQQWVGFLLYGYFIKSQKQYLRNNSSCLWMSVCGQNNTFHLTKAPTPTQLRTKLSSRSWSTLQTRRCNLKCRFTATYVVAHIHTHAHASLNHSVSCKNPRNSSSDKKVSIWCSFQPCRIFYGAAFHHIKTTLQPLFLYFFKCTLMFWSMWLL